MKLNNKTFKTLFDLLRYLLSACIVVLIFGLSYQILTETYINKESKYEGVSFHNLPDDTMDVLVLGSSHAQYSFSPAFFYEDTGLYSYVLGTGGQPLEMSYEMLKEGLKTQSPKLVILEVYTALPLRIAAEADYNYITPGHQMTGQEKYNAFNYLPEEKRKQYLNEFINTHNDWKDDWISIRSLKKGIKKTYLQLTNQREIDYSKIDDAFGFIENYPQYPVDNYWYAYNTHDYIDVELDELDRVSLDNIYNLCEQNDIQLLLYKTPIDGLDQENISYLHKVWEWADERSIPYIDFIELSPDIDFCMWLHSDSFHSYINGASVITSYISDVVNEKFTFDHKEIDILTKLNKEGDGWETTEFLNYECNPKKYLRRLYNYSNVILIKYNSGDVTETIKQFLNEYNINPSSNYYGIYDNGELIQYDNEQLNIDYLDKHIIINSDSIFVDNEIIYSGGGDLICVIYNKDFEKYYVKATDTKSMWEWGVGFYGNEN